MPLLTVLLLRVLWHAVVLVTAVLHRPPAKVRSAPKKYGLQPDSPISILTLVAAGDQLEPAVLARGLQSWMTAGVREVIVVIGPEAQRCHRVLENFPVTVIRRRLDVRLDLQAGWRAADSDYVALVNPGTVWAQDVAERVSAAFTTTVGAVAVRQNAYHVKGLVHRLADIEQDVMTFGPASAEVHFGRAVIGSWKGTAVFRRNALLDVEPAFIEKSLPASGFGWALAELVTRSGWDSTFARSARIWPVLPGTLRQLVSEAFAQGRDGWPGFRLAALGRRKGTRVWRLNGRIGCALAWLLAGPATLMSLGYGAAAIRAGVWQLAAVLALWAAAGRVMVMLPHLRRRPSSMLVIPIHVVVAAVLDVAGFTGFVFGGVSLLTRRAQSRNPAAAGGIPAPRDPSTPAAPSGDIDPALRLMPVKPPATIHLPSQPSATVVDVAEAERTQNA